jgi:signal transduction histidine kinase
VKPQRNALGVIPSDLAAPQRFARKFLQVVLKRFGVERAALYLYNPNLGDLEIDEAVGVAAKWKERRVALGQGVVGWVGSRGEAARADLQKTAGGLGREGSEMAAPLSEGESLVGVIAVGTKKKNYFKEGQEQELADLAKEAMGWLGLAWKLAGAQEEGERSAALAGVGAAIGAEETSSAILAKVTREAARLCGANLASLFLLDAKSETLRLEVSEGASKRYQAQAVIHLSETALGYVVRRQKPWSVSYISQSPQDPHTELIQKEGIHSFLAVPLAEKKGALGILCVGTRRVRRFSDSETRLFQGLAGLAAAALQRTKLAVQLGQTELELRQRERLSSLGMLAAEVAHEVRNPLAVIRMLWHTAIRGLCPTEEQGRDLQLIETKLGQMNGILDRVLNLARSADPFMGEVDAKDVMEEVALLVRIKLSASKIRLILNFQKGGPIRIRGDRSQLEQAVLNLVLNAQESMTEGGQLQLGAVRKGEEVVFVVEDSGKGMKKEVADRLFEPFLSGRPEGTGLGMALVRRTVEAHGGRLRIKSKPGKGTKVEMWLPAWADSKTN